MRIYAVGYYMKDSCMIQSKYHQGFDRDAFYHHYCFCWFWMEYYVQLWMERKQNNLDVENSLEGMEYADDVYLISHTYEHMQRKLDDV
jgi:hypothetical protein